MTPEMEKGRDEFVAVLRELADHLARDLDTASEEDKDAFRKSHAKVLYFLIAAAPPEIAMRVILQTSAKAALEGPQTMKRVRDVMAKANITPTALDNADSREFIEDLEVLIELEKGKFGKPGDLPKDKQEEVRALLVKSIERTMFRLSTGLSLEEFVDLIRRVFVRNEVDLFLCTGDLVPIIRDLARNSEEFKNTKKKMTETEHPRDATDFFDHLLN